MSEEIKINVPLDSATKAALEARAAENGRATGREAAMIIRRELAGVRRRAAGCGTMRTTPF